MAGGERNIYDLYDWQAQSDFGPIQDTAPTIPGTAVNEPAQTTNPDQDVSSYRPSWQRRIGTTAVRGAVSLALVVGAARAVDSIIENGNQPAQHAAVALPCNAPSPRAAQAVENLFNTSEGGYGTIDAVQKTGVHLNYDLSGSNAPYSQLGTTEDTTTHPGYSINWANQSLSLFGFTIQDGIAGGKYDGLTNPTKAELDADVNHALYEITDPLTSAPIELVHLSGLKKIILMANPRSNVSYEWEDAKTIVWNIAYQPYNGEMNAALYEGVDTTECSFADQNTDPHYANLNDGGSINIYGPKGDNQGLYSLGQFADKQYNPLDGQRIDIEGSLISNNEFVAYAYRQGNKSGNYSDYCRIVNRYLKNIVVPTPESFNSAAADKGDLGGMLLDTSLDDNYNSLLNPQSPVLRRKAMFLLARLYDKAPKVVKYLADVNGGYSDYSSNCP